MQSEALDAGAILLTAPMQQAIAAASIEFKTA
jgi:hypothetical protein